MKSSKPLKTIFYKKKQAVWDEQYRRGYWNVLKSSLEEDRFNVVRQLITQYRKGGKIMEVGCGEGILQSKMDQSDYSYFLGIDISEEAVKKASYLNNIQTKYLRYDMEKFKTSDKFDIVIFNESLYYSSNPLPLVGKYIKYLNPDGLIITSIYETPPNLKLIEILNESYTVVESRITTNERGKWYCNVYKNPEV